MTKEKCPECETGFLYEKKDGKFTLKRCFSCGYYWNDSEGYDELSRRLFKNYFRNLQGWNPSPDVGQPYTSPVDWTKP